MQLTDSHYHLSFPDFCKDIEEVKKNSCATDTNVM